MTVAVKPRRASPTAFKMTYATVPEIDLHEATADALNLLLLPPAEWSTFPAGAVPLPPEHAAKLQRMGLKPGWPDILVIHGGKVFGVELKTATGDLSSTRLVRTRSGALRMVEGQADVFPRLNRAGMAIAVCRSVPEVLGALAQWHVPTRQAAS